MFKKATPSISIVNSRQAAWALLQWNAESRQAELSLEGSAATAQAPAEQQAGARSACAAAPVCSKGPALKADEVEERITVQKLQDGVLFACFVYNCAPADRKVPGKQ